MDSDRLIQNFEQELLAAEHVLCTEYSFELAEPYYRRCLADIRKAPHLQLQFERVMLDLFEAKRVSDEPLAYLMHKLRWTGVRDQMEKWLREMPHAIATGAPYEKVLAAYGEDWENKAFYRFL